MPCCSFPSGLGQRPGGCGPGLHRNDISGPWFARIEERAHVNDGAGFLVRIMRGGNGDVSMPEKLRRRKDAFAGCHDRARFFSQNVEGFVAFDAMRL